MKHWYTESYDTLMTEIKEDTTKWKDILYLWVGRPNIVKMSILPKAFYGFSAICIKIPNGIPNEPILKRQQYEGALKYFSA